MIDSKERRKIVTLWDYLVLIVKAYMWITGTLIALIVVILIWQALFPRKDPLTRIEDEARRIAKKDLQKGRRKGSLRAGKVTRNKANERLFYVEFTEPHVTVTVNIEDRKVVAKRWHS